MTDWTQDEALRDALLAEMVASMPPPPRPGDFTKAQYVAATGQTGPTADYRLGNLVRDGVLETQECTIDGRTVRVWRKPS
jgi:hypothetical protein